MTHPRILIVDDQRDIVRLIHSTLDTLGHKLEIVESPSGEEALLEASRKKVDLLVSDYRLPGMTGVELMEKIRLRHTEAKAILITGMTDKKSRDEMLNAGAFALFDKPIPLADFLDAVERRLSLERTILPTEADDESPHQTTLSDLLANFRQRAEAAAIFLLSDRGRVLARAGELHDSSMEVSLISALMAIYNAGLKVSHFNHEDHPNSTHVFHGGDQDMILVPVNTANALLVSGDKVSDPKHLPVLLNELSELQSEVEKVLRSIGVAPQLEGVASASTAEQPVEDEIPSGELENLLAQSEKKKLKPDDVETYWKDALGKQGVLQLDPDKLTYEQARQLGLTPQDDKK
jgi:CheY-like chemotaxis protein